MIHIPLSHFQQHRSRPMPDLPLASEGQLLTRRIRRICLAEVLAHLGVVAAVSVAGTLLVALNPILMAGHLAGVVSPEVALGAIFGSYIALAIAGIDRYAEQVIHRRECPMTAIEAMLLMLNAGTAAGFYLLL